ncbi:MAG: hypothetical protein AAGC92_08000 [Pseudomonadota bacterium]
MIRSVLTAICCIFATGPLVGQAEDTKASPNIEAAKTASTKPDAKTPLGRFALAKALLRHSQTSGDLAFALAALRLAASALPQADLVEFQATARDLAHGDAAAGAQIARILAETPRGLVVALSAPITGRVSARSSFLVDDALLTFEGQARAEIMLSGDGGADLDLIVRDDAGNEICRSERPFDHEYCDWIPSRTGLFRVEIVNHDASDSAFELWAN